MATFFFQGRGNVYLQSINTDGTLDPAFKVCSDQLTISFAIETWSHINRCGAIDVEDARGTKAESASVNLVLADMADKSLARGVFGTVEAAGSPDSVSGEVLGTFETGDFYFLGGKERHRNITGLTLSADGTSPATSLTVDVNYTIDAASGRVEFLTTPNGIVSASYGHTDPTAVSFFTAGQQEYFLSYEYINKQQQNTEGSLELYRVRFDPADNLDFQSDEFQSMTLNGSVLADTDREHDDEFGQFGRRILDHTDV